MTYKCDDVKHHRGSRNFTDYAGNVLNLKKEKNFGISKIIFLGRIEKVYKNYLQFL
jgi:hypothetical protein